MVFDLSQLNWTPLNEEKKTEKEKYRSVKMDINQSVASILPAN